jgi:small subunit ribosomal protein S9
MTPGTGKFIVNGREVADYLMRSVLVQAANLAFEATGTEQRYDVRARCIGGGISGQADALKMGIARALLVVDENYRVALRKAGLLTRDSREVERKKPGQPGARKRFQFSKR